MHLTSKLTKKLSGISWVYVLVALGAVFFVILVLFLRAHEQKAALQHAQTDSNWSLMVRAVTEQDHVIGSAGAPIQVIVYSDFECKYCKQLFGDVIPRLQLAYPDKIVFAFRNFPLPSQPGTEVEAAAAECVNQVSGQSVYWKYAQYLFKHTPMHGDLSALTQAASAVGADQNKFTACMQAGGGKARVEQDRLEASIAGIHITPSEILKSQTRAFVVVGEYYSQLDTGIRYLLDAAKQ